jgi:streptogramin lyase
MTLFGRQDRRLLAVVMATSVLPKRLFSLVSCGGVTFVTEFPIATPTSRSTGIAAGPDGNLWLTGTSGNEIRCLTSAGDFLRFLIPAAGSTPDSITVGPDNKSLWLTEREGSKIGRIPSPNP